MKRIVAKFLPQTNEGKRVVPVFNEDGSRVIIEFDVTDQILKMGKAAAMEIEDMDYSADYLWHEYVEEHPEKEHDGPFEVVVESSIRDFFKG